MLISPEKIKFLIPVILVAVISIILMRIPQNRAEEAIIGASGQSPHINIAKNQSITQTFLATGKPITNLILFSPSTNLKNQSAEVQVLDESNNIISQGTLSSNRYNHDILKLTFDLKPFTPKEKQLLKINITSIGSKPLPLHINTAEKYKNGQLLNSTQDANLSFSLIYSLPTNASNKQGLVAGFVVLFSSLIMSWLPKRQWLIAIIIVLVTIPLSINAFWFSSGDWGQSDWDYYQSQHENFRQIVLQYHEFPFWNPFMYGGVAGLGDPEFSVLSFTFLNNLIFGIPTGFKISVFMSAIIASLGMLFLCKQLKLSAQAALLTAIAFPLSTTVLLKFVEGHIQHLSIAWIPWVFATWLIAYRKKSTAIIPGTLLAIMFYQGGIYMLFYLVPALLLIVFLAKNFRAALKTTLLTGLWSFGLSAFKLIPVAYWIKEFPDESYFISSFSLFHWADIFLGRHLHGSRILFDQGAGWHEYGAYIGPVILALALISLAHIRKYRLTKILLLGTIITFATAVAGPFLVPIFDVLTWLPRSNISRIALYTVLSVVLLAGIGLNFLQRTRINYLVPALIGLAAIDLMTLAYPLSQQAFIVPHTVGPITYSPHPVNFSNETYTVRVKGSDEDRSFALAKKGYGTLSYRPPLAPLLSVKPTKNLDQTTSNFIMTNNPDTKTNLVSWSPTKIVLTIDTPQETIIILNNNLTKAWTVNNLQVQEHDDLVGTTVPAGKNQLTFKYKTPGLTLGLLITLATLILTAFLVIPQNIRSISTKAFS